MTDTTLTPEPSMADVTEASIRAFVAAQSADLATATAERYAITTNALFVFLDAVDVEPRFGPEIAEHLAAARARLGAGAFLPTLGIVSVLRVLPDFLDDPWLPPRGAQRRSHRSVIDRLVTHLRRHLADAGPVRDDLRRVRRAVGTARSRDYDWSRRDLAETDKVFTVTATIEVGQATLDRMLDGVEEGRHSSLDAAIEAAVDPERGPDAWMYRW
jgi:hypothetical protein